MQDVLIVKWKKMLSGKVKVSGSKNATLPILWASLLLNWKLILHNVPQISDVKIILEIIEWLWVQYTWQWNTLFLDSSNITNKNPDFSKMRRIRGSISLIPALLHFLKSIKIPTPGWCIIWKRSIDWHLNWLTKIWYKYKLLKDSEIALSWKVKWWKKVLNAQFSVTMTENLIIANVLRLGKTIIKSVAIEPHIMNLITFLRKAWADIKIRYDHEIIISGVEKLNNNFEFEIISDYIEAGTYMIIGALTSKEYIDIENARIADLYTFLEKLEEVGIKIKNLWRDTLRVYKAKKLKWVQIQTNIFPGFPTDLQAPFAILMSQAKWISKIHEVLFEWRLNILIELEKMWANVAILNSHEALIFWPNTLRWATTVDSWDLRAWAAMIIASLIRDWETKITNINYIYRWYENFVGKLQKLWADIREEKED